MRSPPLPPQPPHSPRAPTARRRRGAERRGRRAELVAGWWLMLCGWRIVGRRVATPWIEVDILARRGDLLALVEVKLRPTPEAAIEAVSGTARQRLARAAAHLALVHTRPGRPISSRVDILALSPRRWPRHIQDVS